MSQNFQSTTVKQSLNTKIMQFIIPYNFLLFLKIILSRSIPLAKSKSVI